MLFSAGGFQSGAIEYATKQGIALVHCTQGGPIYETKARGRPLGPCREYEAWVVSPCEHGGPNYAREGYEALTRYLFGD